MIKEVEVENIEQCEVIDVENPCEDDVGSMKMSVYKDAISTTRKYSSSKHAKKGIEVFVFNLFNPKEKKTRITML